MGIEIIGKLTQKNNGDFKLVDLEDIDYDGTGKNAKQEIEKKIEDVKNSLDAPTIKSDIQDLKDNKINLIEDETSMEGISDTEHDTLETKDKRIIGAINEVNSQCKDIAKKTIVEGSKLYLAKTDGTKLDSGTDLPQIDLSNYAKKEDVGSPTQEQVDTWLNAHPEATTTVQDKSITPEKTSFIEQKGAKNLYTNAGYTDNTRVNNLGQLLTEGQTYFFTLKNLIKVEPGKTYSFSINNGKTPITIDSIVQKQYEFLDDFRLTKFENNKSTITTVENTNFLGLSFQKSLLEENGGQYTTIDDFLNDFVIQEAPTNEEIKGLSLEGVKVSYIDDEITGIKNNQISTQTMKIYLADFSTNTLFQCPILQFSNGYVHWRAENNGYTASTGNIISKDKDNTIVEKIILPSLDAWDTIDSKGNLNKCTKEIDLSTADWWRDESKDTDTTLAFGLWLNIHNIEKGDPGQGEKATYKISVTNFIKTYGNVTPTKNAMAYGSYNKDLGQSFNLSILKTDLTTLDIDGLKAYLSKNNVKIKVKLVDNITKTTTSPIKVVHDGTVINDGLSVQASQNGRKKSNLHGKNLMTLGDSLTALGKWQAIVMEDLGIKSLTNLAVGGQRVSKFAEKVTADNITDIDVVIVMGYFNSYDCPAGTSDDASSNEDTASIWAGYKYIINKLKTLKPDIDIVIMSTHKPAPPNNTDARAQLVKEIAEYYSLPFIDIHNEGGFNEYTYTLYLYDDKIHSNDLGYKKEAALITGGLRRIFG